MNLNIVWELSMSVYYNSKIIEDVTLTILDLFKEI